LRGAAGDAMRIRIAKHSSSIYLEKEDQKNRQCLGTSPPGQTGGSCYALRETGRRELGERPWSVLGREPVEIDRTAPAGTLREKLLKKHEAESDR
jgi:hypothetical protein